jgi:hypothetical protein
MINNIRVSLYSGVLVFLQQIPALHCQFLQLARALTHACELDLLRKIFVTTVFNRRIQQQLDALLTTNRTFYRRGVNIEAGRSAFH